MSSKRYIKNGLEKLQYCSQWQIIIKVVVMLNLSAPESAAQTTLQFQNLTQQDGLSSNYVQCIYQDHEGFIWIGTENGLNRFDGKHFLEFRFDPQDKETLDDNWIKTIYEDSAHNLWIGTNKGINKLNRKTKKIERIPFLNNGQFVNGLVYSIREGAPGEVWATTLSKGLFKLEKGQNWEAKQIVFEGSLVKADIGLRTFDIVHSTDTDLWIVNSEGIDHIHLPSQKVFNHKFATVQGSHPLLQDWISSSYDDNGKIYVGFGTNLFVLDITKKEPALHLIDKFENRSNQRVAISKKMLLNDPGSLLITSYRDLVLYNLGKGEIEFIRKEQQITENLFANPVHAIFKDKQGCYWIGTSGGGLFLGQNSRKAFTLYQNDPVNPFSISAGQVRSFLEDEHGHLWAGIIFHGLDYLAIQPDGFLRKQKSIVVTSDKQNSLTSNRVIKIIRGSDDYIWVATNDKGLIKLDTNGTVLETFTNSSDNLNSLSGNRIWGLVEDQNRSIWVGTWKDGLNCMDPSSGGIKRFYHDPSNPNSLISNKIRCLYFDRKGILWIGTFDGLDSYDSKTNQFTHFQYNPNLPGSISDNLVWSIFEDKGGNLWVGTDTGLNRFNKETQKFDHFFEKDGLPDNSIYGIMEDDSGFIWVSTKNGLARQLPPAAVTAFFPLKQDNGLETVSFLPKAYLNSSQSELLYFGSTNGILMVKPSLLQSDIPQPQFALHALTIINPYAEEDKKLDDYFINNRKETLKLGYQDQFISITLSDLNWKDQAGLHYEYQLTGLDYQWMPLEQDMQVTFRSLPPGGYRLQARARNPENVSSKPVELLRFQVFPPWWKSGWAYTTYLLLISLMVLLLYRFFLRRQFEKQETQKIKALDAFKNKLYTNITHEFRTPLTVISGMIDQIEKDPGRWLKPGAEMVRKNNDNLLDLINQILDLQKLESGHLHVNLQMGDILPFLQSIIQQFQDYAQNKGHHLEFKTNEENLIMDYDPEKTLRIVTNLVSNAIKFTPENGSIVVTVSCETTTVSERRDWLLISVNDSGPGIPKDQIPHIFDRFFQVRDPHLQNLVGSGIGLSLVQEMAHLLKGKVEVSSEEGKGANFKVFLPITQSAPPIVDGGAFNINRVLKGRQVHSGPNPNNTITPRQIALIVEDNADIAGYLQICLENHYQTLWATDGQQGIDLACEQIPDIIISDVVMPKKDGLALCETLKADVRTSHIPIIMLTAKSDVESRILGLKYGADDYLAKPFHEEELLVRMQNLLSLRLKLQERYKDLYNLPNSEAEMPASNLEDPFILQLKELFEGRMLDPSFNLDLLCKELNLSRSQLGRKVKAITGMSPAIFLRSLRLQRARHLLKSSNLSVKEVTFEVGFSDPSYFSKSYVEAFGERPSITRGG